MRRAALLLALSLPAAAAPPLAEDVLARFRAAIGGAALDAVRGVTALADCTGPRGAYVTEVVSARDGRLLFRQEHAEGRRYEGGVDGIAWETDGATVTIADEPSEATMRGHDLHGLVLDLRARFRTGAVEEVPFEGRPAVRIALTDPAGRAAAATFDAATGLLTRLDLTNPSERGPREIVVLLSDWRPVGRLRLFRRAEFRHGGETYRFAYRSVELAADDARLRLPAAVRAVVSSCRTNAVDLEKERAALLAVHRQDREAHLGADAGLLLEHADDTFVTAFDGKVQTTTRDDFRRRFEKVFDGATYLAWDDLEPPVVTVSPDGRLGWMIVRVRVRRLKRDGDAPAREESFEFSGLMTYAKKDGRWVRTANASTFASGS